MKTEHYQKSGRCRVCGCTEEYGCPGGCEWADLWRTLCSRCARNMSILILRIRKETR